LRLRVSLCQRIHSKFNVAKKILTQRESASNIHPSAHRKKP
jgi:hypothetical protein